jgi:hypothetical protein
MSKKAVAKITTVYSGGYLLPEKVSGYRYSDGEATKIDLLLSNRSR